jgi:hypothetical protein|tara:strand:+ start:1425 stop:1574 length:150 start_codon:yes stop_codon:yes gene_type:complete
MAVAFYYGAKFDAKERCARERSLFISRFRFSRTPLTRSVLRRNSQGEAV